MIPSKVYFIDDDQDVRHWLQQTFDSVRIDCAGFADGREFLRQDLAKLQGCVLVDLRLPGIGGLDVLFQVKQACPAMPVIMISAFGTPPTAVRAMQLGALDFLEKPLEPQRVLDVVTGALRRFQTDRHHYEIQRAVALRFATLSPREREVANLIVAGASSKQIAAKLSLSAFTADRHRYNVMKKMEADSIADLVRMICSLGDNSA